MSFLIDTHIAVWIVDDSPMLSRQARVALQGARSDYFVSAASIWEIAIKYMLRRGTNRDMRISGFEAIAKFEASGFEILAISALHAAEAGALPLQHVDPFDRLMVAQAQLEGMRLLTHDSKLLAYGDFVELV